MIFVFDIPLSVRASEKSTACIRMQPDDLRYPKSSSAEVLHAVLREAGDDDAAAQAHGNLAGEIQSTCFRDLSRRIRCCGVDSESKSVYTGFSSLDRLAF